MTGVTEIRWHARAGQGAKSAAQALAMAALADGRSVQTFPEYGPERRGAPLRAYTRIADRPIRLHDGVTAPDVVVVLEASLVRDQSVADGLKATGIVLVNGDEPPEGLAGVDVRCVPATRLAAAHGSGFVNLVMLGATAAAVGTPLAETQAAAVRLLGKKAGADHVARAVEEGYACLS